MIMSKKRTFLSIIPLLLVIGLVVFPTSGLSKTRQEYTADFLKSTQDPISGAFSEYNTYSDESGDTETAIATKSAIVGLNMLDALNDVSTDATQTWLLDYINWGIDYNSLENISENVESLSIIDSEEVTDYGRINDFKDYANDRLIDFGGYKGYAIDIGENATIFGSYFVVKAYHFFDIKEELDSDNITAFVVESLDEDGGFKSSPTSVGSSLSATFYAVQILSYLDSLSSLSANFTQIGQYINQFYVDESSYEDHYGGYSTGPDIELPHATVRATFEAVTTLKSIDISLPDQQATINWVLNTQNQVDGGFSENMGEGTELKSSSITTYQVIRILDAIGQLDLLSEQFGDYKLRWWIVLIIVVVLVGLGIGGIIIYQRRIKL
jgi:prenyltransferase beta subunit